MKIEEEGQRLIITEGRFLPRFVRYFAVSTIVCGFALFICGFFLIFTADRAIFQTVIAFFLSVAAVCYGIYLLFLFPDVRVTLDKKTAKTEIVTRRLWDRSVRELETRRITALLVEKSDGASGSDIFRIVFRTYKGEGIPLSGAWTPNREAVEADARKIFVFLDPACTLELPKVIAPPPNVVLHTAQEPVVEASTRRPTAASMRPPMPKE